MRDSILSILFVASCLWVGPALAQELAGPAADLDGLRRQWHRCVRQSFSGQPAGVEKRAAERAALAACKAPEDAYVAAELAARTVEGRAEGIQRDGLTTRARAWMATVATYVVDPVASWFGR